MIAIQFTNGFEINVIDVCGRAIYPTISRVNHSCIPCISHANVKKSGANSAIAQASGMPIMPSICYTFYFTIL